MQVNTSLNANPNNTEQESPMNGLFSPTSSQANQNIFSSVTSPQNAQSTNQSGAGLTLPQGGLNSRGKASINFSKPYAGK